MDYIIILCTTDSFTKAEEISNYIVERELAACVNIVDRITSVYKWKGEIVKDKEFLMIIKTKKILFDDVKKAIENIHNYEVPEIISVDITNGSKSYLNWIDKVCK